MHITEVITPRASRKADSHEGLKKAVSNLRVALRASGKTAFHGLVGLSKVNLINAGMCCGILVE